MEKTKALIHTRSGTKIQIEGSPQEVKEVIRYIEADERKKEELSTRRIKGKFSTTGAIRDLVNEGFFDVERNFNDITREIAKEYGFIVESTSLSPILIKLVDKAELTRRINNQGEWIYSKP